jgi:hypothetical protein
MVNLSIPQDVLLAKEGEMYIYNNTTPFTIDTADAIHLLRQFSVGELKGWTFDAGSTGSITVFADAGGGQVIVTVVGHTLANGDVISITGTSNYNGVYVVANVSGNTFEITETWNGDDATGTMNQGSSLIASVGSDGDYQVSGGISSSAVGANETFEYIIYVNGTAQIKAVTERKFSANDLGAMPITGNISIVAGDIVTIGTQNVGASGNLINKHMNINLSKTS